MKYKYQYINFAEQQSKTKTKVFWILSNSSNTKLGIIKWYSPWRQYCFYPDRFTIFNKGCLEDINTFIQQLMDERRNASVA